DGHEVAVKVLRPGVEEAFERDFAMFYWAARLIERARPDMRRLKPVESVRALEETVEIEMDLRFEAAAAAELAEHFAGDQTFHIPAIDWQRTARRVLTTERVNGIPIDERDALMAVGHDPEDIVAKMGGIFFNMVFRDGLFHADMHPGNLFVESDGTIAAVDFGIMGRVDRRTRRHLGEMLIAFLNGDYRRAAEVHFEAGWVPPHKSVDAFTQACRSIGEPIFGKPQNEISMARLLGQLFQVTEYFDMETQPQLLQLQKTMLLIEGTGRDLYPDTNMWLLARPLIEEWVVENLGPEARLRETLFEAAEAVRRLPRVLEGLERAADTFTEDGLRLHPDTLRAMRGDRSFNGAANWWPLIALGATIFALFSLLFS
ncbi:MAG: AarF/UbiB family protein, partial [Rhodospirillales bacterium]|nr:AarF/UbiB family protein [Rhodospirillales bacterium]